MGCWPGRNLSCFPRKNGREVLDQDGDVGPYGRNSIGAPDQRAEPADKPKKLKPRHERAAGAGGDQARKSWFRFFAAGHPRAAGDGDHSAAPAVTEKKAKKHGAKSRGPGHIVDGGAPSNPAQQSSQADAQAAAAAGVVAIAAASGGATEASDQSGGHHHHHHHHHHHNHTPCGDVGGTHHTSNDVFTSGGGGGFSSGDAGLGGNGGFSSFGGGDGGFSSFGGGDGGFSSGGPAG
ncbi:hypothetical protein H4R18_003027 [Coemansia javaensis]|uniref:Uncharacterized protein n=1 Tax=Coemansia javaensis TaxID=2761396 RepID=A0A9W8LJ80_9FUNG|nr:hypothetical protein H4R18_003027 [Coemansia javaensis]